MINNYVIITDIGSTTTKALLLKKEKNQYKFLGYEKAFTTVEKPFEDVKFGIKNAIQQLEKVHNISLISSSGDINSNVTYLTTSSAGGGLQILVIGLTKSESASSAERAAFGVGGVLLDTISIDDDRSNIEKMNIFNTLHPDIILFSGGIDNGNLFSILRLAEILKLANPTPKFDNTTSERIPLVFAGNKDAVDFVETVFSNKFNLHVVPNLRPTMAEENLEPTKEKIHELFMNNVMEQAPGYSAVKKMVSSDIIPTPSGVLKTMKILGKKHDKVLAFDIGGATTDIYSNINNFYHRTVSANFGMSYSIGNVFTEAIDEIKKIIEPQNFPVLLNYIGNKIIYPDFQPTQEFDIFIEHILAIQAIKMSLKQHIKMHFLKNRVGFLDNIKKLPSRDKWTETMYYPHYDKNMLFKKSDIEVIIGAGGVISHATNEQAILMLIEGMQPDGIVELWRDKHFISPHLGVLSNVDEKLAEQLVFNECFEKLAVCIRPFIRKYHKKNILLTVEIESISSADKTPTHRKYEIKSNEVIYINEDKNKVISSRKLTLNLSKDCFLENNVVELNNNLPIIIDTRDRESINSFNIIVAAISDRHRTDGISPLNVAAISDRHINGETPFVHPSNRHQSPPLFTNHIIKFALPYEGTIFVSKGNDVDPTTILAENKFDPPKVYVVLISSMIGQTLTEEEISEGLLIKVNDIVSTGDKIFTYKPALTLFNLNENAYSPVRGIVEQINMKTGTIILREIQDYPTKPVEINLAKRLDVNPKNIKGYMKKRLGDFIYAGDTIAVNHAKNYKNIVSPYTGNIKNIDVKKGTIKICYDTNPYQIIAQCYGLVDNVTENNEIFVSVHAIKLEGKIGFGKDVGGNFSVIDYPDHYKLKSNPIIYLKHINNYSELQFFSDENVSGLICNTISYSTLKQFINKDLGVALTGNEAIPFSLIILDGFSDVPLYDDTDYFKQFEGKYLLLKPHTQIRAGATRPKIFVFY